jgi:hypothetical protein
MIRLLEPKNDLTPANVPHIELLGKQWVINDYVGSSDAPEYTCISYAWGVEKTKNPFCDDYSMSTMTVPAIETAIGVTHAPSNWANNIRFSHKEDLLKEAAGQEMALKASQALWVDALCVPSEEPARTDCLQAMGKIFSSAYQVLVVLTEQCSDAVRNTTQNGELISSDLILLEKEDWVSRAWTYQEAVNCKRLYFMVEKANDAIVSGHDFLNAIMVAIEAYKEVNSIGKLAWEGQRPKLRSLERLLADYLISDFATRSAYQVMSVMDQRHSERTDDHFFAMIGSVTATTENVEGNEKLDPSEYFMRVCEQKGDFSFLYGTGPRSVNLGRRWRPIAGRYPALLPDLITLGSTETGHTEPTHLQLDNMYRLRRGMVTQDGLKAARWFVDDKSDVNPSDYVAAQVLKRLRVLGFDGCGKYLEFEAGFFFPQVEQLQTDDMFVVVSHEIHWVTGGPGLLLRTSDSDINDFCDVGVFVGRRPKSGDTIKVG